MRVNYRKLLVGTILSQMLEPDKRRPRPKEMTREEHDAFLRCWGEAYDEMRRITGADVRDAAIAKERSERKFNMKFLPPEDDEWKNVGDG